MGPKTNDKYILQLLEAGRIRVDLETGTVYRIYKNGKEVALTGFKNHSGYLVFTLRFSGESHPCRAHRIVWVAANGVVPDGYTIDHINNKKLDNRLENLQLLTREDNLRKAGRDGLLSNRPQCLACKLDPKERNNIVCLYQTTRTSQRELAQQFGISKTRVWQILQAA